MKKTRNKNMDKPVGKMTLVADFLPPPEELVLPERTVKVTLRLDASSLKFFKAHAKKNHTKYQKMIRKVLEKYTAKYAS